MGQKTMDVISDEPRDRLEREVEAIRGNLGHIASELALRRRQLLDWRLRLRNNRGSIAIAAAGAAMVAGVAFALRARRRRQNARVSVRVRTWRDAFKRALQHPERMARPEPGLAKQAATAAATNAAGAFGRIAVRSIVGSNPSSG